MKKFFSFVLLAVMVLVIPFCVSGCGGDDQKETYNVIATVASIPPVVASLESIQSGYQTYAWVERGKTYSGIDQLDKFTNIGFDKTKNLSTGITDSVSTTITSTIEQIIDRNENAFINLYCVDYNAYAVYAIAVKAGLKDNQFKIIMVEDGSGAYADAKANYVDGKTSAEDAYDGYLNKVNEVNAKLLEIKQSNGTEEGLYQVIDNTVALALASNSNFEYIFQSKPTLKAVLDGNTAIADSNLYYTLGLKDNAPASVKKANIKFKSISNYVSELNAEQKDQYLKLMFGDDKVLTSQLFTRTAVGETTVPSKKLVFIGGRVVQSDYGYVADMTSLEQFTAGYDKLLPEYKELFLTENDYTVIYDLINQSTLPDGAKLQALNIYLEYVYSLKITKRLYGSEYDVLFKGHPSELVNDISSWQDSRYTYKADDLDVGTSFKELEYALVGAFYSLDSEGKTIGVLPGGVAAENFAYIGEGEFALAGFASSTYTGYEKDIIIEYILTNGKETLDSQDYSGNVKSRYDEGSLVWKKGTNDFSTLMLNRGNVYKTLAEFYGSINETELQTRYSTLLNNWLIANGEGITSENVDEYTINRIGQIVHK